MRERFLSCLLATCALLVAGGAAADPTSVTLDFETACLDLDAGVVETACQVAAITAEEPTWDVLVAYDADRTVKAVLVQNRANAVEVAHLEGATFATTGPDAVAGATFTAELVDVAFGSDRVILVETDLGAVFKLGNVSEDEDGLTFDYEQL